MEPIRYYNRLTEQYEVEKVYGEAFLRLTYGNPLGALALDKLIKRASFSKWYGERMDQPKSAARIPKFIDQYGLNPDEFRDDPASYKNFNEFFYRKLKASSRLIEPDKHTIVFPADGRHLGFQCASEIEGVFVKGQQFDLPALLGDDALAAKYANGALVLSRLCPVDYHRFHFPLAGIPTETCLINGPLYSVSPIALRKNLSYLWQNKRTITELKTSHAGTVLLLEIGATCVGSIHQTFTPMIAVNKGEEKGFFAFGGSSTITIFEPGSVILDEDLVEHSAQQTELYAQIGSSMAQFA